MTDVYYFPWRFFKAKLWYVDMDIHDDKCSLYGPHSQGWKQLWLELILTLSLTLTYP